ncbi:DUF1836 domain-containing protein [Acetobacterium paludosum]|uniref:DUF1836 domain-containing protein n=1 Tax=Acetobacterium paludosum TaxID=52693 RepID=A0A923HST7_9FIRM|nr:DUF1836 domain-containing protein [Acetobacterium paludosum]MBC3887993.1 DUF1836 domain-containing protein [Acetobacterium paludosum]
MKSIASDILNFHCPRWNELPEIDLYMDQVVSILEKNCSLFTENEGEKIITATMINNYVKHKIIAPPVKRRYNQTHLAYLFVVCIMKRILSISEIGDLIFYLINVYSIEDAYDLFCEELEFAIKTVFAPNQKANPIKAETTHQLMLLEAVVLAFANKLYFQNEIKKLAIDREEAKKITVVKTEN